MSVVSGDYKDGVVMLGSPLLAAKIIRARRVTSAPMSFYAIAGQTYRFAIYNNQYWDSAFTLGLGYTSSIPSGAAFVAPLANDNYSDAFVFSSAGGSAVFYTRGATPEPFESDMVSSVDAGGYFQKNAGVWAQWRASVSGKVTITAQTVEKSDVVLVAGVGDSLNTFRQNLIVLRRVGAAEVKAGLNGITFNCVAGTTYQLYFLCKDDDQLLVSVSPSGGSGGVPALFAAQAGTYSCLVGSNGMMTLSLSKTGKFTGKLVYDVYSLALRGQLNADGDWSGTPVNSSEPVTLNLDMSAATGVPGNIAISGTVGAGGAQAFTAYHAVYNPAFSLSQAGTFTTLLEPTQALATVPQGKGYGSVKVGQTGKASYKGKLADGTAFASGGTLVGDGSGGAQLVVFNNSIHSRQGRLSGAISFNQTAAHDCSATLGWNKPAKVGAPYYAAGFTTSLTLEGVRYTVPIRAIALNFTVGADNGTFTASGGSLAGPISETITLAVTNKITVTGANPQQLKATISPGSGKISGSFIHPATSKPVSFSGVLFQNIATPRAGGYFLGPVQSGTGLSGAVGIAAK